EIGEYRDVDAEGPEHRQPRRLLIHRAGISELFVEMEMEMADEHFVSRQRLIDVVVGEGHDGLLRGVTAFRTEVEIHRHPLLGSRRGIIKSKVVEVTSGFVDPAIPYRIGYAPRLCPDLAIRLTRADGEGGIAILAVVDISKIGLDFPRPKELVGRR